MITSLSLRQCSIEQAIGSLRSAAIRHAEKGDDDKATKLFQLAAEVKALRDPEVVAFLDRRRLKKAMAQQAGAACA